MESLRSDALRPFVRERIEPFFKEILEGRENIHSLHVVGSAVTEDFVQDVSDINGVIVLKTMELAFLDRVAPLGKKYGKRGISAPLIMTPEYIHDSLDVFPIEFLNFKLMHETVFGPDILAEIEIDRHNLRLQCEREIKSKLIGLRQNYISSMGDIKLLLKNIADSISGFMPLFRGIVFLMGKEPSKNAALIVRTIGECSKSRTDVFQRVYEIKHKKYKPSKKEIASMFEEYYGASENIGRIVNDLRA